MRDAGLHRSLPNTRGMVFGALLSLAAISVDAAAPPNDNFTNASVITDIASLIVATNSDASAEAGEPLHAGSTGGHSLWWSWQAPFTGSVFVSTAGSSFDTLLGVYAGEAITNLEFVADNDDTGGFGDVTSYVVFRAIAGETYRIAVDGFEGATGTVQLAIGHPGYPAPAWSVLDVNGRPVTSGDFSNRVLVIDFWETTCGACVEELPDLKQLYTNLLADGFSFVGVSMDSAMVDVKAFVLEHQIPYVVARGTKQIDHAFGTNVAFPTKFIIDRENNVVQQYSAATTDYKGYAKIMRPLLRGSKRVPLTIRRGEDAFVFAWPAVEFGYRLETAGTLEATNWLPFLYQLVTTNDENIVTVPITSGSQFFRLRKTPAQ